MGPAEKKKMREAIASSPAGLAALDMLLEEPDPVTSSLLELTKGVLGVDKTPETTAKPSPPETADQKPE